MRAIRVVVVVSFLLAGLACSSRKELTNSSARSLLEDAIQRDQKETMLVPMDDLLKHLTTDWIYEDYRSMTAEGNDDRSLFRRLIDAGYIDQKTTSEFYLDLAGDFRAEDHPQPGGPSSKPSHRTYRINLSTLPSSRFVSGWYEYHYWESTGQETFSGHGNVKGTLGTDAVNLEFPYGFPSGRYGVSKRGDEVELKGPTPHGQMTLSGQPKGGQIDVPKYSYSPSQKILGAATEKCRSDGKGRCISFGKFVVGDVTRLLLDSPESASGAFNWHFEASDLAVAMQPTLVQKKGVGSIQFRKQPDGDWVLVGYSY